MRRFEPGAVVQVMIVLYRSDLSLTQVEDLFRARADRYRAVEGLLEKLYVRDPSSGRVGGVYIFDSAESLRRFRGSDLASSIAAAYQVVDRAEVRTFDVVMELRGALRNSAKGALGGR